MSKEAGVVETMQSKAHSDARRKYAWASSFPAVNDNLECVLLLGRLNEAISTMCALQDDHYTDWIWNASTYQKEALEKAGLTEDLFEMVERKLTELRAILMGENLNYDELYQNLYLSALGHEVYWKEFYEDRVRELEYKVRKYECNGKKEVTEDD